MQRFLVILLLIASAASSLAREPLPQDLDPAAVWSRAEALFQEGSYELARREYAGLVLDELDAEARRWVEFRLADLGWRAAAVESDQSEVEAFLTRLATLSPLGTRVEERDRVWAEAQASLGAQRWTRGRNWEAQAAYEHYSRALEWWGRSSDIATAREHWLALFWEMAEPDWAPGPFATSYGRDALPLELADQALGLARDPDERARALFVIAQLLERRGDEPRYEARRFETLERVVAEGAGAGLVDDGLFALAEHLAWRGRWQRDADGRWQREPDLGAGAARYRELLGRFTPSSSGLWNQAEQRLQQIEREELRVWTPGVFRPGSEVGFQLEWRNLDRVTFELKPVDLERLPRFADSGRSGSQWLQVLAEQASARGLSWSVELGDASDHRERRRMFPLPEPLPEEVGAYLLEVRGGSRVSRELLLVTDLALVLSGTGRELAVWAVDAAGGQPREGASVVAQARVRQEGAWVWRRFEAATDGDGLARFDLGSMDRADLVVTAGSGAHQAIATAWANQPGWRARFKALVSTDRPAYRPGQSVRYQVLARHWNEDAWTAHAGEALSMRVRGPRGDVVHERELALSEFGSAHGELEIDGGWVLGSYSVELLDEDGTSLDSAPFFQLEEYRRPDFRVTVRTPRDAQGAPRRFVLGDAVEVEVLAETYAGAPLGGAEVELVIERRAFQPELPPLPRFAWFVPDDDGASWWRSWGYEEVARTLARTDDAGGASTLLETSAFDEHGWEYRIRARVTDSLRREVEGQGTVRVGARSFGARVELERRVIAPGEAFDADVRTEDLNGRPISVAGSITLLRVFELSDEAFLERYGADAVPGPETPREVETEVARQALTTDASGYGSWRVRPQWTGHFVVRFEALDEASGGRVQGQARGYLIMDEAELVDCSARTGAIELVLDRREYGEGERVTGVLLADVPGRTVLVSLIANGRVDLSVVRIPGTASLIEVDLGRRHVPELRIEVCSVHDGRLDRDGAQVVVAPTTRALNLAATLQLDSFAPGDETAIAIALTDRDGRPVRGEVTLTVFDESLTAISQERTSDPRRWFYASGLYTPTTSGTSLVKEHALFAWDAEAFNSEVGIGGGYRGPGDTLPPGETREALRSLGYDGGVADSDLEFGANSAAAPRAGRAALQGKSGASGAAAPVVRTDFRETALWAPAVVTDAEGRASVELRWPDSTTAWRLVAIANDGGGRFGFERREAAKTALPLLLRLGTPRFLVAGDAPTLTTAVLNHTGTRQSVEVRLDLFGPDGSTPIDPARPDAMRIDLEPGEERSLDWPVSVGQPGELRVVATVRSGGHGDAVERRLPVLERGLEVVVAASGVVEDRRGSVEIDLPRSRPGSTAVEAVVTPSLAATAIEALPYLADYPYGCLEQSLSRFVPAVVTLHTLNRLGFERGEVARAALERATTDRPGRDEEQSLAELDRMVAEGLERVLSMQLGDGGFSWWPGGSADPFMSGYAVWTLALAREAGIAVPAAALENGFAFLERRMVESFESDLELAAWSLHAAAVARRSLDLGHADAGFASMLDRIHVRRAGLGPYGLACLALAAEAAGREELFGVLARNLTDGAVLSDGVGPGAAQPGARSASRATVHWGEVGIAGRWSKDGVEATAFSLRALLAIDPDHEYVEPAIEWLVLARRGASWKSTRDTAICVLSLIDAVERRGELASAGEFELLVDGVVRGGGRLPAGVDALSPVRWPLGDLGPGPHRVEVTREGGRGRLYFAVTARTFTIEQPIAPRANELAVRRDLVRLAGRETLLSGRVFARVELADGDPVDSGERVELVQVFETRVPLEYVVIEGWKPAGFEAVEVTSGWGASLAELEASEVERRYGQGLQGLETVGDGLPATREGYTGRRVAVYRELRDARVTHFVDHLPAGLWELRTTLRAETPGRFTALPTAARAMYAPDLAGNSSSSTQQVR